MELNTIASSFGCMSALTGQMHRHLLGRFGSERSNAGDAVRNHAKSIDIDPGVVQEGRLESLIPDNPALTALPKALAAAHEYYGVKDAVVLFVVQPGETNAVDQRLLEIKLWDDYSVRVVRMSLSQVISRSQLQVLIGTSDLTTVYCVLPSGEGWYSIQQSMNLGLSFTGKTRLLTVLLTVLYH